MLYLLKCSDFTNGGIALINVDNYLGRIVLSHEYLSSLIGQTATACFGVVAMNASGAKQNFLSLIKGTGSVDKGVGITYIHNRLTINLHITVMFGTNIAAIVDSIMNKVRYAVEEATGLSVAKVNVFVDGMAG